MAEVKLDFDTSWELLLDEGNDAGARVIAACAVAYFLMAESELDATEKQICHRLLRMAAARLDGDGA